MAIPLPKFMTALVAAISADVVAGLIELDMPPLTDGAVLLGAARSNETFAPPRIVMQPVAWALAERDEATSSAGPEAPDWLIAMLQRSLGSLVITFRVQVSGIADPDPGSDQVTDDDLDMTDQYLRQFLRSCLNIMPGIVTSARGTYRNAGQPDEPILGVTGWYAEGLIDIPTPILDYPLGFIVDDPKTQKPPVTIQTKIQPIDGGTPEDGPTFDTPGA